MKRKIELIILSIIVITFFSSQLILAYLDRQENLIVEKFTNYLINDNNNSNGDIFLNAKYEKSINNFLNKYDISYFGYQVYETKNLNEKQKKIFLSVKLNYKKIDGYLDGECEFPCYLIIEKNEDRWYISETNLIKKFYLLKVITILLVISLFLSIFFIYHILKNIKDEKWRFFWFMVILFGNLLGMLIYVMYIKKIKNRSLYKKLIEDKIQKIKKFRIKHLSYLGLIFTLPIVIYFLINKNTFNEKIGQIKIALMFFVAPFVSILVIIVILYFWIKFIGKDFLQIVTSLEEYFNILLAITILGQTCEFIFQDKNIFLGVYMVLGMIFACRVFDFIIYLKQKKI